MASHGAARARRPGCNDQAVIDRTAALFRRFILPCSPGHVRANRRPSGGVKIEGLRGKNALVQAVVKNIARKEAKEPEMRSDDEVRAELRAKGELVVKVRHGGDADCTFRRTA